MKIIKAETGLDNSRPLSATFLVNWLLNKENAKKFVRIICILRLIVQNTIIKTDNMKKTFTLIFSLMILTSFSQNFTFSPTSELSKQIISTDVSDLNIDILRESSVDTLHLEYVLIMNTLPSEWYAGYCDNHGCWGSLPENGVMSPLFDVFNSFIKLSINPNNIEGSGTVEYYIYEVGDYDNGQSMTFNIETPGFVGIADISGLEFDFYPNPVQNQLIVRSEKTIKQISVFDLTGKSIFQITENINSSLHIDAQQWQSGIYLLEVIDHNNNKETRKVIKQ